MSFKDTLELHEKLQASHRKALELFNDANRLQEEAFNTRDPSEKSKKLRQALTKQKEAIVKSRKFMELQKELLRLQQENINDSAR